LFLLERFKIFTIFSQTWSTMPKTVGIQYVKNFLGHSIYWMRWWLSSQPIWYYISCAVETVSLSNLRRSHSLSALFAGGRCGSWPPTDMVTMSSEKAAARRKADSNNGGQAGPAAGSGASAAAASNNEDSPNQLVYKKVCGWDKVNTVLIYSVCTLYCAC
jgi:hypothetical protein